MHRCRKPVSTQSFLLTWARRRWVAMLLRYGTPNCENRRPPTIRPTTQHDCVHSGLFAILITATTACDSCCLACVGACLAASGPLAISQTTMDPSLPPSHMLWAAVSPYCAASSRPLAQFVATVGMPTRLGATCFAEGMRRCKQYRLKPPCLQERPSRTKNHAAETKNARLTQNRTKKRRLNALGTTQRSAYLHFDVRQCPTTPH